MGFINRIMDKMDSKLEETSKKKKCCCCQDNEDKTEDPCCK